MGSVSAKGWVWATLQTKIGSGDAPTEAGRYSKDTTANNHEFTVSTNLKMKIAYDYYYKSNDQSCYLGDSFNYPIPLCSYTKTGTSATASDVDTYTVPLVEKFVIDERYISNAFAQDQSYPSTNTVTAIAGVVDSTSILPTPGDLQVNVTTGIPDSGYATSYTLANLQAQADSVIVGTDYACTYVNKTLPG